MERGTQRRQLAGVLCGSKFGVVVDGLDLRSCATTRMPERKNLDFVTADPVVKVVVNSSKMDAPYAFCLGIQCGDPDPRLRTKERKRLGELFVQCPRSKRPILLPPSSSLLNVRVGSLGNPNPHGRSAATAGKFLKHLFGRDHLTTIGLGDR